MHSSFWTYLKRAMAIALVVGPILALVSVEAEAPAGAAGAAGAAEAVSAADMKSGRREPMSEAAEVAATLTGAMQRDVNVNHRDVNVNRNVNVDVDNNWRYPAGAAAVAVGTAVAVGAVVSTLPPSCNTFVADGVTYQNCGGTYYAPRYDGPNVVYEVVSPPSGWNQ